MAIQSLNWKPLFRFRMVAILKAKIYFLFIYTLISGLERAPEAEAPLFLLYFLKLSVALLMFTRKPVSDLVRTMYLMAR